MSAPRTVSLVLGSGGARGFAHIGVIQALVKNGFDIRSIAGTSMGALVGGIYAAGRLDVYTRWVTALERGDVIRLLDFAFDRKGLFKGEKIINLLRDLIGDRNIEDLPVSFTAVATDLRTHKEVWLRRGPLFYAVRASISIPTIFTPFDYLDMQLVDGGLLDPIPIAPTLHDHNDLTVAVGLNGTPDPELNRADPAPERPFSFYHQRIARYIEALYQRREQRDSRRSESHRDRRPIDGHDAKCHRSFSARRLFARSLHRDPRQCLRLSRIPPRAGADRDRAPQG